MLAEGMVIISPSEVTPAAGEGTLGTWRFPNRSQAQNWGSRVLKRGTSFVANLGSVGRIGDSCERFAPRGKATKG